MKILLGVIGDAGGIMKIVCITIVLLTTLSGTAKAAQDALPAFSTPDTSNPPVAAFVAWHVALVKGDFASFRDLTPVVPNITNDLLRQTFDQMRQTTPKTVKITEPKLRKV